MVDITRDDARKRNLRIKLLRMLPRRELEDASAHTHPERFERTELEAYVLENWDDNVVEEIIKYVEEAR